MVIFGSMILLSTYHALPPIWLVVPFVVLLLSIATGPVLFSHFWHAHYKLISVLLALFVGSYYLFVKEEWFIVLETLAEYISFISLLASLFIASGGIYIFADVESNAVNNIKFLIIGALLTNLIGTTGASVLLIRPFMRINRYRLKPYHIVFFIFFISNLGGLLTPIGDPPLFMGYLKGVPFFWTMKHLWMEWLLAMAFLSAVFYYFEKKNTLLDEVDTSSHYTNKIKIDGKRNFVWLGLIILTVFIDPNTIDGLPYIDIHGKKVSYIREILQLIISFSCYKFASKKALNNNSFDFEPIKEVGFLFVGIFLTMIPALQLLSSLGSNSSFTLSEGMVYWASGIFSSMLDNAPTYINFFTLSATIFGVDIQSTDSVRSFLLTDNAIYIMAVSVGSVFFGALTYIGNGPNFMVKAIAEQTGVKMPGFFQYIIRYSLPILLPLLTIVYLIFYF